MPTIAQDVGLDSISGCNKEHRSTRRRRANVAVPAKYRNRPFSIRAAIYRVWERSADHGFTRATTAVLQAIIAAGVSATNPFEPVFAKKSTLAKQAGYSEVSVYRAMRKLEKDGWICRAAQARMEDGVLNIGLITITEKLADFVGLVVSKSDQTSPSNTQGGTNECFNDVGQSSPGPDRAEKLDPDVPSGIDSSPDNSVNERRSREVAQRKNAGSPALMKDGLKDGPIYRGEQMVYPKASVYNQSTRRQFIRMDGRAVAQELVWLITEGRLTYGQLFKLQRLAKQVQGQELSDFVAYRSERLKQLTTTNDCYRYLKKFIDDGIDARYLCAQRAKMQHRTKRTRQRKKIEDVVTNWAKSFDGRTLVSAKTGKEYLVHAQSGTIEIVREGVPANISMKIDRRFMRAVQAGELALKNTSKATLAIMISPTPCRRTEEEFQRAETSIARMKAMLKGSACKIQTIAK